ncbi:C40 family peptidase [Lederbergia citri]|uniref:C40 family peptidase n=1 Tax=Lederbergia citri TaxID=2833580 RepID=A0A942YHZ4_9BACI|nr:NlpC/P60 family protein [Lederbergia citri]MBS4194901.1 C40 family peptidase [Lederbergia citri]
MKKVLISTTLTLTLGLSTMAVPTIQPTTVSAATLNPYNNQVAVNAKADQLIKTAKSLIGKATYSTKEYKSTYPYKFSCATFIDYVFKQNGVDLATYNEDYMMEQGYYVPRSELQKGDLVLFRSNKKTGTLPDHVGMYIGDNKIIHMADSKQNIVISDMNSKPYYTESYLTARRVLPSLLPANPATKGDNIVSQAYGLMNKVTMSSTNNEQSMKFNGPGFVNYVYKNNGVNLGTTDIKQLMNKGTTVSKANLKKGDLIFFGSNNPSMVAIYAGDHRIIIPSSSKIQTRVLFVDYYKQNYITAKRVFTEKAVKDITTNVSTPKASESTPKVNESTSKADQGTPKSNESTPKANESTPKVNESTPKADQNTPKANENTTKADAIVNFASNLMGKAKFGYTYNESNLTFTGGGFTYYVFKQHGIDLKSKMTAQQALEGKKVLKSNLQKGDLIYFSTNNKGTKITQSGIYIGSNQYIMLSTNGQVVKDSLSSTWSVKNYVTARRAL